MKKTELECDYFGFCGSCNLNLDYSKQVLFKKEFLEDSFKEFFLGEFEFYTSKIYGFRSRSEFGFFHDNDGLHYTMRGIDGKIIKINECLIVDKKISFLMPNLINLISKNNNLKSKIFGAEFITTRDEIMVILLYHKDINLIKDELEQLSIALNINLIARSRGKKLIFKSEDLNEKLFINGKFYHYKFGDAAFIQPNRNMNEIMISWALKCIDKREDLLELYCGHGNFTIPLSTKFHKVLATEISKKSIYYAIKNRELNNASNIEFIRISAAELLEAFSFKRRFKRLENLDLNKYNFSHILIDPPRSGCDNTVLDFIKNYENIIYISCNPSSLKENLKELCKTHSITKFAIFDQFVHTKHIECGVSLKKYLF